MSPAQSSEPGPGVDDFELMRLVKEGRKEAFEELVRRHQQPMLNFFSRMGVYRDAEDLVQETFVRVFKYRDRYRPAAKFTTFLYTVARHVFLDRIRKSNRQQEVTESLALELSGEQDNGMGNAGMRMDVHAALAAIPEKMRSVVILSIFQGLTYEEISEVLEIPVGTVKSRMFTAMDRMKEVLDERA